MAVITYTAKDRGDLMAGHSAGTEYTLEIPLTKWDRDFKDEARTTRSLSGTPHTVFHRTDRIYRFATVSTDNTNLINSLREFASSVAAGETFTLDPYGSIASPDEALLVTMHRRLDERREHQTAFSFSGQVIEV